MSVTRPTLKPPPLDELDELVDEPPLLLELLELVVLLLLLPHAASASVAAITSTDRPKGLNVLPVTGSPFLRSEGATLALGGDAGQHPLTLRSSMAPAVDTCEAAGRKRTH